MTTHHAIQYRRFAGITAAIIGLIVWCLLFGSCIYAPANTIKADTVSIEPIDTLHSEIDTCNIVLAHSQYLEALTKRKGAKLSTLLEYQKSLFPACACEIMQNIKERP
ncbi:MAG: hypothetical protein ABIN91_11160 [Mucilaginibacter sp.]|uniref:hypothetical protein n=1 Tax=Mucilaginibacter sp. TaxID=1882438 RepID=UPI0032645FCF